MNECLNMNSLNLKHKLQTDIRLCLDSPPRSPIAVTHFRRIKWFPVPERVESYIVIVAFKNWNGVATIISS